MLLQLQSMFKQFGMTRSTFTRSQTEMLPASSYARQFGSWDNAFQQLHKEQLQRARSIAQESICKLFPNVLAYSDFFVLDKKLSLSIQPAVPVPVGYTAYWPIEPDPRNVIDITLGVLLSDSIDVEILGYVVLPRGIAGSDAWRISTSSVREELFGRTDLEFLKVSCSSVSPFLERLYMSADIVPFKARRYKAIAISLIKVIKSRNRDGELFEMNVGSIKQNSMLKPVRVNDKFFSRSGMYELICGEGRLTAHQRLGHETIVAEVVTCDRKEAYLQSLVRRPFAR